MVASIGATAAGQTLADCPTGALNSVDLIASDMSLRHEAPPAGVPKSYDWAEGPRIGYGNEPPPGWSAFIAWGQVYLAAEAKAPPNTRVEIRDLAAWRLDDDNGGWTLIQSDTLVDGAAFAEDFLGNASRLADIRSEPGGGISVTAGDGHNFHFWPSSGRTAMPEQPMGGVFVSVKARLILDDPAAPDDRKEARYLMSVGADYWRAPDAEWLPDWSTVGDAAIGRFRLIGTEWQSFNMTTVSREVLCASPPPLN